MGQNIFIRDEDEDIIIYTSKKGREGGGVERPNIPTGINLIEL